MKSFSCNVCDQLVFFENSQCVKCGYQLAYLPELGEMRAFTWEMFDPEATQVDLPDEGAWRPCANYKEHDICNWGVAADDGNPHCRSCRLTHVIPNLSEPQNLTAWFKLESAKRRLLYTLMELGVVPEAKAENPAAGLEFQFLADAEDGSSPILTGHNQGCITINIAEADDVERERRRLQMHEPYRTLLGHFRHESGHYFWDRWIGDSSELDAFRAMFGDERRDYADALKQHYEQGPPADWQTNFISTYASSHPWEDWAESWAHYLHMRDVLEIAGWSGLRIRPPQRDVPGAVIQPPAAGTKLSFDRLLTDWFPLTYVINNLNRGLGLPDGYPFVLSPAVTAKLRFVHEITERATGTATEEALVPVLALAN